LGRRGGAPLWFLIVFCGSFGTAGLASLLRLPRQARRYFTSDGAVVFVVDTQGIGLAHGVGTEPKRWPWSSIAEIVLAERMQRHEADESVFLKRQLIVFLQSEANAAATWLDRIKSGVARSGEGRVYLSGDYPHGQGAALLAEIRRLAPGSIAARACAKVVFDTKAHCDTYAES
jgi:hypothetical protein